jgi:hypothetical protein
MDVGKYLAERFYQLLFAATNYPDSACGWSIVHTSKRILFNHDIMCT